MYPNESDAIRDTQPWVPEKPKEQQEAEQQEQSRAVASIPVLTDVLDWLDEQASFYTMIDSIEVNDKSTATDVRVAMALAKKMQGAFRSKSAEFRAKYARHLKEQADEAA